MEIRTASKTLPSKHFSGPEGANPGNTFLPVQGVIYSVVSPVEIEGVKLNPGQGVKLMFKNKKHSHFMVL